MASGQVQSGHSAHGVSIVIDKVRTFWGLFVRDSEYFIFCLPFDVTYEFCKPHSFSVYGIESGPWTCVLSM